MGFDPSLNISADTPSGVTQADSFPFVNNADVLIGSSLTQGPAGIGQANPSATSTGPAQSGATDSANPGAGLPTATVAVSPFVWAALAAIVILALHLAP